MVKELQSYVGGAAAVKELLLEGCSAGGIGTFHNSDYVAAQFPAAKVRGNPQAGYFGLAIADFDHFSHNTTDPDPHHFRDKCVPRVPPSC